MATVTALKTERITVLGSPRFKSYLETEAQKEGISVSELVRRRCMNESASHTKKSDDEELETLVALTGELRKVTAQATKSLEQGLKDAESVLAELRGKRDFN